MRFKFHTVENLSSNCSVTQEGYRIYQNVPVARSGTMYYAENELPFESNDGIITVNRAEGELFRDDTIASVIGKPLVIGHPEDDVGVDTWAKLSKGIMFNPRRELSDDCEFLVCDLMVTERSAIQEIDAGLRELSLGYDADYSILDDGTVQQHNIIVNHLALVERGRCGERCFINDSQSEELWMKITNKQRTKTLDRIAQIRQKVKDALSESFEGEALEEAVEAAVQSITAAVEQANEPEKVESTQDTPETIEVGKMIEGLEKSILEVMQRLQSLEEQFANLSQPSATADSGQEPVVEKDTTDEEGEQMIRDEMPEEAENVIATKDSSALHSLYMETRAGAEILAPGMQIGTYDSKRDPGTTMKLICGMRKKALDAALKNENADVVMSLSNKPVKQMTCDAAAILFRAAVSSISRDNNAETIRSGFGGKPQSETENSAFTIDDWNKRNRSFYK